MIQVHNLMEELVFERVSELYDQVKDMNTTWLTCDCENCRIDTVNYVLNRIQPKYVVSGRGVTHNLNLINDTQLKADIDSLAIEGMRLVSSAKRPYHNSATIKKISLPKGPVFNFPTFGGSVFDGSTFEPLRDAKILLKLDNNIAEMMDITWANPAQTFSATKGNYTFWVRQIPCEKEKESRIFNFSLEIKADGYSPVTYSFEVPLVSENINRNEVNSTYSLKIQDLFLFRKDVENLME